MAEYLSAEALEKLKQEVHMLKTAKRQEIAARLEHAKSLGDLSENAEYQEAKEEQAFLEGRISELEDAVESAIIIDTNSNSHGVRVVSLGSKIVIEPTNHAGPKTTFIIVGSEEAAPSEGRISNASPIGMVLLGHKEGEMVSAKTPGGVRNYKILKIE